VSKGVWVAINVNYKCNRNCDFCYMGTIRRKGDITITSGVINRIIEKYKDHIEREGFTDFDCFLIVGGEPTLDMEPLKEIVGKLRAKDMPEIKMIALHTNGILLNPNFIEWTKEKKTGLFLSANESDFDFLEDRMKMISSIRGRKFCLNTVLTPKNLQRLESLIDLAAKYTNFVKFRHEYYRITDSYIKLYDECMPKAIKMILDKEYSFAPFLMFEVMNPFWPLDRPFLNLCGRSYVTVDPNGEVRSCPAREEVIGSIFDEDFDYVSIFKKKGIQRYTYDGIPKCENCYYRNVCGSGCPLTKESFYGPNSRGKPSPFCRTFKKVLPVLLKLASKTKQGKNIFKGRTS